MPHSYQLFAPVSGETMSLDNVPDPVFSEKMTGDGLAILADSEEILAPCDGTITVFFDTHHAFALTTREGIQILVHVGLDSVILGGEGITALHHAGDQVKAGTPIVKIDLEFLKKKKINMISPLLIVNHEKVLSFQPIAAGKKVQAGKDPVLTFTV